MAAAMEAKVATLAKTVAKLEAKLKTKDDIEEKLEARLRIMEDIEAIKKLQRAYSYYLEHWQEEEVLGLWSHSPDATVEMNNGGQYKGWEQVKDCFHFADHYTAYGGVEKPPGIFLHLLMPIAGIVDVDPDGQTAKGRWYGLGHNALIRGGINRALITAGTWENDYVKEDGKWKFKKLFWLNIFSSPWEDGWVKTPYISNPPHKQKVPPGPNTHFLVYPSGYIFPYHYKNPVTGK